MSDEPSEEKDVRDLAWQQAVTEDAERLPSQRRGIIRVLQERADAEQADLKAEVQKVVQETQAHIDEAAATVGISPDTATGMRLALDTIREKLEERGLVDPEEWPSEERLKSMPFDELLAASSVGRIPNSAVAEALDTYRQLRGRELTPRQERQKAEALKVLRAVATEEDL